MTEETYREKAFKFYPPKCNNCGIKHPVLLCVHHKDKNHLNNDINNLEILCCNCHRLAHHTGAVICDAKKLYMPTITIQIKQKGIKSKSISLYGLNVSVDDVRDVAADAVSELFKRKNAHLLDENGELKK